MLLLLYLSSQSSHPHESFCYNAQFQQWIEHRHQCQNVHVSQQLVVFLLVWQCQIPLPTKKNYLKLLYVCWTQTLTSCAHDDTICPCPAHCSPPPVHSLHALRLWHPAQWIFMIDRQRLALGGGIETGLVDIHYVVTWTANQSGLVTSVPILVFLGLSVLNLGPMYATDVRQTDVR